MTMLCMVLLADSCKNAGKPPEKDIVRNEEQLGEQVAKDLRKTIRYAADNQAKMDDSTQLMSFNLVQSAYKQHDFKPFWSRQDEFEPAGDTLCTLIEHAMEYGLFPEDYHCSMLKKIRKKMRSDSLSRRDAALWTRADVLLTEAYFTMAKHLKLGRLGSDSVALRKDSLFPNDYFLHTFTEATSRGNISASLQAMEPVYPGYQRVKAGIKRFLDSARFRPYTYIYFPFKDSLAFVKSLQKRLAEDGFFDPKGRGDSAYLTAGIRAYQQAKHITPTGKITESLIRSLNNTDWDRFKSVAVTLDRYKLMPDTLPATYVLVNLPSYSLYVYDDDTLALQSKVIVGSPRTRTPLLNSAISNFITYPQWTVPYSIIFREMLPRIQKDVNYLRRQNLMVVNGKDEVLDPHTIDWSKLSQKRFPYLIRQKQGDDNSLGVIKFNFRNKYSVYLHDTNTRWQFSKAVRDISHGCVRVQEWEKLSHFLVRADTVRYPADTLRAWIGRQEKHLVSGFPRVPLFIRYLTIDGKDGKLLFYNDIYGYDRLLKEKYFAGKKIV